MSMLPSSEPRPGTVHDGPSGVICPGCGESVFVHTDCLNCPRCGQSGRRLAGNLIDFTGDEPEGLESLLRWPDALITELQPALLAIGSGIERSRAGRVALQQQRLLGPDSRLTEFGRRLLWSLQSEGWQEGDELPELMRRTAFGAGSRVLDVGCNTGKALRTLGTWGGDWYAGVDLDILALALGRLLAEQQRCPILFVCASAYSLPFPDGSFTHVICRNALTYMHHRRSLREMVRVLAPGGHLVLRFENLRYDLCKLGALLLPPRGAHALCCRSRDLIVGMVHALSGWQPRPDHRSRLLRHGRCYASVGRTTSTLRKLGCRVLSIGQGRCCPRYLGASTQTSVVIQKSH